MVCRLTEASCEDLASVLSSATSQLCVLEMMFNEIGDVGFARLSRALHSPHCQLQEIQYVCMQQYLFLFASLHPDITVSQMNMCVCVY